MDYPLINGHRFDWSSVRIAFNGALFTAVKSVNYSNKLDPGYIRGTNSQYIGRTRGEYSPGGSIEFYKEEYYDFIKTITANGARGYMEVAFGMTVQYETFGRAVLTDTIAGARITSDEDDHGESPDGLSIKCDLSPMYILRNGFSPIDPSVFRR